MYRVKNTIFYVVGKWLPLACLVSVKKKQQKWNSENLPQTNKQNQNAIVIFSLGKKNREEEEAEELEGEKVC